MNLTLLLSQQIAVIALMVLFGFIAGKTGVINVESSAHISKLVLYIIAPCIVIDAFQMELTSEKILGCLMSLAAAVIFHAFLLLLGFLLRRFFGFNPIEETSVVYSNCGNLLIPIIGYVLGKEYVFYCCVFMSVQLVLIWTHGISLIAGREYRSFKKIILNPNILAIFAGLIIFLGQIRLPEIVSSAISRTGDCVGPLSMIVIGILIASADLKQVLGDKKTWMVSFIRLIICPGAALVVLGFMDISSLVPDAEKILYVSFLAFAAPSASTVSQLANVHDRHAIQAGSINIMTVLFCMVTMPVMTILYQMFCM